MGIVIGIIIVLALAAFFAVLTCKSKNSDLFKWLGIAIFIAFCLTWIVPYGYFQSGEFVEYGMNRLGFTDIPTILYYAVYFGLTTILYLLALGGFYGVLSKTKSYSALVAKTTKGMKKHMCLTTILTIIFFAILTSFVNSMFVLLIFVPFTISCLLKAKYDKLTTMGITFGSILVGTFGASFGTEALTWLNSYLGVEEPTSAIFYRIILGAVALIVFVLYNVYRTKKIVKKNKNDESKDDEFAVEEVKGKVKTWPIIVLLGITIVFVIMGFINWDNIFGTEVFANFHTTVTELSFFEVDDEAFTIFSYILGTSSAALGTFELTALLVYVLVLSVVVALMSKMKLADYMNNFGEGFKKMVKPVGLYVVTFILFIVVYMSPFTASLTNWAFGLTKSFNPYIVAITAFINSIFHADLGYTAYLTGSYLTTNFSDDLALAHSIYMATYSLAQIFLPTGGLLLVGLSYLKLDYKAWFKYIWLFVAVIVVALLIMISIGAYAL